MTPLKELGYIKAGMVLVDRNGREATITGIYGDNPDGFTIVEMNGKHEFMWFWDSIDPKIMVKEM